MTRQKTFKSQVRTRMAKTGESYTSARRQLLPDEKPSREMPPLDSPLLPQPDEAVRQNTGHGWHAWIGRLDDWGADQRTHAEIARWLVEDHGVPGWWAQGITVGYERVRGLRVIGQRRDGTFYATASKTIRVGAWDLVHAIADAALRPRWLPGGGLTVTRVTPGKSLSATWETDGSKVVVTVTSPAAGKSVAGIEHSGLPHADASAEMKAFWRERLSALKSVLEDDGG